MKRTRIAVTACTIGTALLICACGADPCAGLSEDSYNKVVNYAAGMLMKYTVGSQDKLTYLDPTYTPEHLVAEVRKDDTTQEADTSDTGSAQNASTVASNSADTQKPDDKEDIGTGRTGTDEQSEDGSDSSETGASSDGEATDDSTASGADGSFGYETGTTQVHSRQSGEQAAADTLIDNSYLQSLSESIQIEYIGYSVRNNYPDAQSQGAVSAATGDKLLVVTFHARNTSDAELLFNTIQSGVSYKLVINSDINGFCLTTMLDNDLSGVYANISAQDYKEVVLLLELPESVAKNINNLDLVVINKGEQQTIRLE